MQNSGIETIYCMVDLHAITTWQNPKELKAATRELAAGFIASGLDPKKSILFNQSQVGAHSELGWVFNCIARMGWLNRMTQFKDKAGKNRENASVGLFAYPHINGSRYSCVPCDSRSCWGGSKAASGAYKRYCYQV